MNYLKRFWNWLLGRTTVDEKVIEVIKEAKKGIVEIKARTSKVVKEAKEVGVALKKVVEESKDVVKAATTPITHKPRKTKAKKFEAKK